jgi:outer membrane protein TolC
MNGKRTVACVLGLVAAGIIGAVPLRGEEEPAKKPAAVMRQMRDTAKQLVSEREQQYRAGLGGIDALLGARKKLREVQLELATDPGERTSILTAAAKAARETEALVKARVGQGVSSNAEYLEAKLARLAAELELVKSGG